MKKVLVVVAMLMSSVVYALPEGGVECKNHNRVSDDYMSVTISGDSAEFNYWESSTEPIKMTAAGVDNFAIVEEKMIISGEGQTWVSIFSAFLSYNWEKNELSVMTVTDGYTRTEVLSCN